MKHSRFAAIALCLTILIVTVSTGIQSYATPIDYHWGIAGIEVVYAYSPVGEGVQTQGIVLGQVIDLKEAPALWTVGWATIVFSSVINTNTLSGVTNGNINVVGNSGEPILTGRLGGAFTLASFPPPATKHELAGNFTGTLVDSGYQVNGNIAVTHFLRAGMPLPDDYYTGVNPGVEVQLSQLLFDEYGLPTDLYDYLLLEAATLLSFSSAEEMFLAGLDPKPFGNESHFTPIPEPTTICLIGFGILGLVVVVIRQRRMVK